MTAVVEPDTGRPSVVKVGDVLVLAPSDYRCSQGVLRLEITSIDWPRVMDRVDDLWIWVEGFPMRGDGDPLWWRSRQLVRVSALLRPQGGGVS